MRALLYLLTLTLICFLKNGFCTKKKGYEAFKTNTKAMSYVEQYYDDENREIKTRDELLKKVQEIGFDIKIRQLGRYLEALKKEGIISSGQASNSNPSYTHDDTTPYGQGPSSNPSYTVGYQHGGNSYTHDDTTPYGQGPSSNPSYTVGYQHGGNSYTHDYTTPYGQESYSNQQATNHQIQREDKSQGHALKSKQQAKNHQTDEDAQTEYWDDTHHLDDSLKRQNQGNEKYWKKWQNE
ncbi:hypothetical protein GPALN_011726 [Globodera pallida]|nr:hypothetical protein GPALN_011726 [Globodera pallida]